MTRDEAIGRIKVRFDKWALDDEDMKAIQTLIPELTESKDEKIRKELIEFIQWSEDRGTTRHDFHQAKRPAEWIAYLEKQKECLADNNKTSTDEDERIRKEINILYSDINACITELLKARTDKDSESEGKALFKMEGLMVATLQDLSCIEDYLEKQKEQNGEDEECTDFTIYYPLKNGKGEYECIPYSFYDSLTFFSEDKDLIDFHRSCFYTEEECNEWIEQHKEEDGYEEIPVESTLEYKLGFKAGKESEKQKKQKHTLKFKVGDKVHMEGDDSVILTITEIKEDRYLTDCGPILFGAEDIWERVEQKPWEWSEEDEKKLERVDDLLWMLDDYLGNDCSICEEKTARLRDEIHNELFPWLEFLRPQYHGDVTMTEAYKMGLEAGKASSWKPSEKQTNNVIVELTRIELGDIINGLYYLKEKYYEDCKEHNGTATVGLSDEFKFYFKRFNEALDLYTRLHELEKERYGTTTDGYYYE